MALSMEFLDAEMTEMFQQEFKKLHVDLANKEIKLFKHMFNHYLSKRIVKIEQFLREYFDDFDSFKPVERPQRSYNPAYAASGGYNATTSTTTPPAKRGPKPKHTKPNQAQAQKNVKIKSEPYPDLDDEEIDLINGFQGHFLDETSDDGIGIGGTGRGGRVDSDDDDDDDDFSRFALQHLETSTPTANKTSSQNGSTSGGGAKCGRKRNAIWQCYDTTFGDDGKVLTNDCLRCGQAVSAKAGRMRSHLMKCREIMREATRYKKSVGDVKRPRNQYSQGQSSTYNSNYNTSRGNYPSTSSTTQSNHALNSSTNSTSSYPGGGSGNGTSTTPYNSTTTTMNYGGGGGNTNTGSNGSYSGNNNAGASTYTPSSVETSYGGGPPPPTSYNDGNGMPTTTSGGGLAPDTTTSSGIVGSSSHSTSPGHVPYVGSSSGSA